MTVRRKVRDEIRRKVVRLFVQVVLVTVLESDKLPCRKAKILERDRRSLRFKPARNSQNRETQRMWDGRCKVGRFNTFFRFARNCPKTGRVRMSEEYVFRRLRMCYIDISSSSRIVTHIGAQVRLGFHQRDDVRERLCQTRDSCSNRCITMRMHLHDLTCYSCFLRNIVVLVHGEQDASMDRLKPIDGIRHLCHHRVLRERLHVHEDALGSGHLLLE